MREETRWERTLARIDRTPVGCLWLGLLTACTLLLSGILAAVLTIAWALWRAGM